MSVGFAVWVGWDALRDIVHVATNEAEDSHIWLVPFAFGWLFWIRLDRHRAVPSGSRWPGAILAGVGVALWWVGYRFQILSAWQFGAVLLVAGALLSVVGGDYLTRFWAAWGVLVFLVPVPNRVRFWIAQPLETSASSATQSICEVVGFNVGRSGNQLSVNGVAVCVAEACNGMRLVFALFLACYVAMFVRQYRVWVRVTVLLAAPVVATAANVVRLVPTIWVYGHRSIATAERFHEAAGAVMVVLAFLAIIFLCDLLQWGGLPMMRPDGAVPAVGGKNRNRKFESVATAVLVVAFGIGAVHRIALPDPRAADGYQQRVREVAAATPLSSGDWTGVEIPIPQASLDELKTNVAISRRLTNRITGVSVDLLILQSSDLRDLVPHYPPVCYPGQGLMLTGSAFVNLDWAGSNGAQTRIVADRYSFEWHDFRRGEPTVVDNFMVLPTGQTQPDTAGMERRVGTDYRYFGCGQVQVVYRTQMTARDRTATTESILEPYLPLFSAIEFGANGRPQQTEAAPASSARGAR